jgi:secreted trypsin-like serine protease
MKKLAILFLALVSSFALSANDKIIGGEFAEYKDYPFIVSVDRWNNHQRKMDHHCCSLCTFQKSIRRLTLTHLKRYEKS